MAKQTDTPVIVNRKAKYEYTLVDEFEAGIILKGTEVKAMRAGNANLSDAYCVFDGGNLIIKSMFIAEYDHGNINNHETRADRRLLLRKRPIQNLFFRARICKTQHLVSPRKEVIRQEK